MSNVITSVKGGSVVKGEAKVVESKVVGAEVKPSAVVTKLTDAAVVKLWFDKPWDEWTYEEMVEAVLVNQGRKVEVLKRVIDNGGRVLRGAFKGYKGRKVNDLDIDYALAIIRFEEGFDAKRGPVVTK